MVRCTRRVCAGQHRRMSQKPSREHSHAMQNESPKIATSVNFGRSSIDRLPPELREAIDRAIADGATIDDITARIRAEGETCSRSAVGRYAKNMRDTIRRQQETDRTVKAWVDALCERPEGQTGLVLIETLRTMVLATMADLSGRDEPVSMQELARISLILKRMESIDKLRADRERAAKKAATRQAKPRGGLSPEAVAIIRAEVEGPPDRPHPRTVTSVPVDPWNPAEFPLSRSSDPIPADPGESHQKEPTESRPETIPPSNGMSQRSPGGGRCPDTRDWSGYDGVTNYKRGLPSW